MKCEHPVYHGIQSLLEFGLPHCSKTLRKRLARFLIGVLAAQAIVINRATAALSVIAPRSVLEQSHQRALLRTLDDSDLSFRNVVTPFFRKLLSFPKTAPIVLIIDETTRNEHFRVLAAAIYCRGRAVPIAVETWRGQQKHKVGYWVHVARLLQKVSKIIPHHIEVIVIADRAFGTPHFTDLVEEKGWNWVVRLQKQTCFRFCQGSGEMKESQLKNFFTAPGSVKEDGYLFKKLGWRECSFVGWWEAEHKEALLLGSNLPASWELVSIYKKRGAIEALFRDWKSMGFQWESSQVQDFDHHKRQLRILMLATAVVLSLGTQRADDELEQRPRSGKHRPYEAKKSIFQMGMCELKSCLYQTSKLPSDWNLGGFELEAWNVSIGEYHGYKGKTELVRENTM